MSRPDRERWGTRWGLVLAAAGNAIGIGNLLRFPGQAAQYGGGAFMIPYVVSLLLFGLPMMWIAWTLGRMGGRWGHGTTPGIFDRLTGGKRWAKYAGVIGLALPMVFILYYTYIEAWCLAYAYFAVSGAWETTPERSVAFDVFFQEFVGNAVTHEYFSGVGPALTFVVVTLALNLFVLYRGVRRGIEVMARVAIPALLVFSVVLAARALTVPAGAGSVLEGLDWLWTPRFGALADPDVWLHAAGQVFFTLGIGFGALECYASYLRPDDDVALTGLTTASLNEFVEVIFGSAIAIPAAAAFYGLVRTQSLAAEGTFTLGMVAMPEVLTHLGASWLFGTIWFLLLFAAAFTSSVAIAQPVMAFLQDELRLTRGAATAVLGMFWLVGTIPVVLLYRWGALDEMDFWAGTIGLVVLATIEALLFALVLGAKRGWEELHRGAEIRIPRMFRFAMIWITPLVLLVILGAWGWGAVRDGRLVAEPSLVWGIEGASARARLPGRFLHETTTDPDEVAALDRFLARVREQVTREGRDLLAWADVTINPGGTIGVGEVRGDPALAGLFTPGNVADYLRLQRLRFEPDAGHPNRSVRIIVAFEARYRALAIAIVRLMIAGFALGFAGLVWAAWRARGDGGAAQEASG